MSKKKFVLDKKGFRDEVFRADFMHQLITDTTNEIAKRAGDGFEPDTSMGKTRWHGMVWAKTAKAEREDAENNILQSAAYPLQVVNNSDD